MFDLFNGYVGKITTTTNSIKITAINVLQKCCVNTETGIVDRENKKVECYVEITKNDNGTYSLDACEKTYEIIGGVGYPIKDYKELKEQCESLLKRYNFVRKQAEQLSLF